MSVEKNEKEKGFFSLDLSNVSFLEGHVGEIMERMSDLTKETSLSLFNRHARSHFEFATKNGKQELNNSLQI